MRDGNPPHGVFVMQVMLRVAVATLAGLAITAAVHAHHGWSGYEQDLQKITGTIDKSSYSNPHSSADIKSADKTWHVVLAPPSRMGNRGLTAEMLKQGTSVQVEGYKHRTDAGEMRAERITIDGKTYELR
jgi:hypothetical protein